VTRRVVLRPEARADLKSIFDWVERATGPAHARDYIRRIRAHYLGLADFPKLGRDRSDLAPGLRTLAFERRATIAYLIEEDAIVILRILHKGRDQGRAFLR
jgi:toxin ParE1/3/4